MNENRIIWFFKEPRSGSTWLSGALSDKLNRPDKHIDKKVKTHNDYNESFNSLTKNADLKNTDWIYCTHFFEFLENMTYYENPILVRCNRKSIIDKVLSTQIQNLSRGKFIHRYSDPIEDTLALNIFNHLMKTPINVHKQDVITTINSIMNRDQLWKTYSTNFENYTIVYEDCEKGVHLPIYEGTIKFGDYTDYVIKTPDYKRELFINYDEVASWIDQYYIPIRD